MACTEPGVTAETLPLLEGYWRANMDVPQQDILECWNQDACAGGVVKDGDVNGYCEPGYMGPCECRRRRRYRKCCCWRRRWNSHRVLLIPCV